MVDGGKGQLSAVLAAMQAFDLPRVAVISLAKREEEVFVPTVPTRSGSTGTPPGCSSSSGSGTRRIASRSASTASGATRGRGSRSSTRSPAWARHGGAPLQHFGSAERFLAASAGGARGRAGHAGQRGAPIYAQLHKAGRG